MFFKTTTQGRERERVKQCRKSDLVFASGERNKFIELKTSFYL
jgi:hypothetical protein